MKVLLSLLLFVAAAGYAAEQTITNEKGEHAVASVPTQEQMDEANAAIDETLGATDAPNGYWHCTAYAEGHGHSWGYDYRDIHYNHAYYGAMQRCEYATHHHCHDVHCHYDHH